MKQEPLGQPAATTDVGRIARELVRKEAARIIADADVPIPDPERLVRALQDDLQSLRDEIRDRSFTRVAAHVEAAAGIPDATVADPPPPALARSATSACVKLRQAELDVHELGEDPRIAVAETLRQHGVATKASSRARKGHGFHPSHPASLALGFLLPVNSDDHGFSASAAAGR